MALTVPVVELDHSDLAPSLAPKVALADQGIECLLALTLGQCRLLAVVRICTRDATVFKQVVLLGPLRLLKLQHAGHFLTGFFCLPLFTLLRVVSETAS